MSSKQGSAPYYFVPGPSKWPVLAGASLLLTMAGASAWVNGISWGPVANILGVLALLVVLYKWFGDAIAESEGGLYSNRIDVSYRWSMSWFIFSELMFFAGFFGALFYARSITMPWLGDIDHKIDRTCGHIRQGPRNQEAAHRLASQGESPPSLPG